MNVALSEILSDLETLETEQDFTRKFEETFAKLGYNKFTYLGLEAELVRGSTLPTASSDVIYFTNLDPLWVHGYVENDYAFSDPTFQDCYTSRLPFRWTETYRSNLRSQEESNMMADAWENGLQRGLTVPVHGPNSELGILSLYSDLSDKEFLRVTETTQYDIHLIAHYIHDAVQNKLRHESVIPMPIALTNRELEILQWTVDGKTAWEVGSILNIAERTVNFHVQNVMEKFGVHNKTQPAAKAIGMGLLDI